MKLRTKIIIVLCGLWMAFIFILSAQSNVESSAISDNVTAAIVETMYSEETPKTPEEAGWKSATPNISEDIRAGLVPKEDVLGRNRFFFKNDIRKLAHIILYFVLAILVNSSFISHFSKNKVSYTAISFGICMIYAVLDELHQEFVPGRSAQIKDVGIDCIGVLFGIVGVALACAVIKLVKAIANKSNKTA